MKTTLLITTAIVLLLANLTFGQSGRKARLYRVVITNLHNDRIEGILYGVSDSTLSYVPNNSQAIRSLRNGEPNVSTVKADEIRQITLRRKGQIVRSMLIGAGVGIAMSVTLATFTKPGDVGNLNLYSPGPSTFKPGVALLNFSRWVIINMGPLGGAEYGAFVGALPRKKITFGDGSFSFKAKRPSIEPFSYEYQTTAR